MSTDQGVAVRVVHDKSPAQLDVTTAALRGSNDWTLVEAAFDAPPKGGLVRVLVVRRPSLKFDNLLSGIVWMTPRALPRSNRHGRRHNALHLESVAALDAHRQTLGRNGHKAGYRLARSAAVTALSLRRSARAMGEMASITFATRSAACPSHSGGTEPCFLTPSRTFFASESSR